MVFSVISSVALVVVAAFVATSAIWAVESANGVEKDAGVKAHFGDRGWKGLWIVIGVGLFLGVVNFVTPKLPLAGLAFIPLVLTLVLLWCLCYYWLKRNVEAPKEIAWCALLALFISGVVFLCAGKAAEVAAAGTIWRLLIGTTVPVMALVATIGYFIAHKLYFESECAEVTDEKKSHNYLVAGRTVFGVFIAALIAIAIIPTVASALNSGSAPDKAFGASGSSAAAATTNSKASVQASEWYKFYNTELQSDSDVSNNFNFGPNPYQDGKTVADYDADFRKRLKWDPALAAASTAWLDAKVGTRYLGEFYESCSGDWAKTMNQAKTRFMKDQKAYYQNLNAYFAYLDSAVKVEVRECKSVSDQMYMNPHTLDRVPDVIVLLTDDHSGHELVYTFMIKGDTFEVAYRIECGYQPTDVAKIMGITPKNASPTSSTSDNPSSPNSPNNPDNPDNPDKPDNPDNPNPPTPPKPNEPKKDPSLLTPINTEPNDNTGPGENTINPSDPNHSTKDRGDNSTSYSSHDAYRDDMDHLSDVNKTQKTGGDSNQPSTTTPTGTTVDNNAEKGTGNGGIDKPTSVDKPAETASGGAITNNSSNAAGAWGDGSDPK